VLSMPALSIKRTYWKSPYTRVRDRRCRLRTMASPASDVPNSV
jgi:hypothetical protein